jgi:hypothetical protein
MADPIALTFGPHTKAKGPYRINDTSINLKKRVTSRYLPRLRRASTDAEDTDEFDEKAADAKWEKMANYLEEARYDDLIAITLALHDKPLWKSDVGEGHLLNNCAMKPTYLSAASVTATPADGEGGGKGPSVAIEPEDETHGDDGGDADPETETPVTTTALKEAAKKAPKAPPTILKILDHEEWTPKITRAWTYLYALRTASKSGHQAPALIRDPNINFLITAARSTGIDWVPRSHKTPQVCGAHLWSYSSWAGWQLQYPEIMDSIEVMRMRRAMREGLPEGHPIHDHPDQLSDELPADVGSLHDENITPLQAQQRNEAIAAGRKAVNAAIKAFYQIPNIHAIPLREEIAASGEAPDPNTAPAEVFTDIFAQLMQVSPLSSGQSDY